MEPTSGNWTAADDVNRLVRQIDVALNGADAAPQAALCDIAGQLATLSRTHGPLLPILQQCLNPICVVTGVELDADAMAEHFAGPIQAVPIEAQGRLTGIDSPHFKAVAWFDTFNAHVYYDRDEAQRAFDGGNPVLPIESVGRKANLLDQVVADALTGKRGVGAMRVSVERIDPESMFTDKPADAIPTSFFAYVVNTLNEVTGGNEWQKDFAPVELGPAVRDAIKTLAVKPKDAGAVPIPEMEVLDVFRDYVVKGYTEAQLIAYGNAREAAGRAGAVPAGWREFLQDLATSKAGVWSVDTLASKASSLLAAAPGQHPPAEPAARAQVGDALHDAMERTIARSLPETQAVIRGEAATTCWQHRPGSPCPTPDSCRSNGCSAVERELFPDAANPSPAHAGPGAEALAVAVEDARSRIGPRRPDDIDYAIAWDRLTQAADILRRLAGGGHA